MDLLNNTVSAQVNKFVPLADLQITTPQSTKTVSGRERSAGAAKFYYVVEGRVPAQVGGEQRTLEPGHLAFARPGEDHGVRNDSDARAVLLVAIAPNPNAPA